MKFEDAFRKGTITASDSLPNRKARLKKLIKSNIEENKLLKEFLEVNHIKGEFIKEATNRALESATRGYSDESATINVLDEFRPLCSSISWSDTSKGISYWVELDQKYARFIKNKNQ